MTFFPPIIWTFSKMKDKQINWGKTLKGWIINDPQIKRPDSNTSCYTQTRIDIIFILFFMSHRLTMGFAWPCHSMLLCLSHISSAAECQCFLWATSKDLSICPILLHFALWIIFGWFILSYLCPWCCGRIALNHLCGGNHTPFHIDSGL